MLHVQPDNGPTHTHTLSGPHWGDDSSPLWFILSPHKGVRTLVKSCFQKGILITYSLLDSTMQQRRRNLEVVRRLMEVLIIRAVIVLFNWERTRHPWFFLQGAFPGSRPCRCLRLSPSEGVLGGSSEGPQPQNDFKTVVRENIKFCLSN